MNYRFMVRFGGRPYYDGIHWRCPECNGFVRPDLPNGDCTVCRAVVRPLQKPAPERRRRVDRQVEAPKREPKPQLRPAPEVPQIYCRCGLPVYWHADVGWTHQSAVIERDHNAEPVAA